MNFGKQFKDGLLLQNPVTVQLLGMCSVMAITTTLFNGIGMGLSVTIILTCSNIVISLLRKIIPSKIRIAAFIVVISTFVTMVDLLLQAFIPALSSSLGVFIPLIVVNCIILGRAEAYANKVAPALAVFDGIGMGIGFTLALTAIGIVRELLGAGTVFGFELLPEAFEPIAIFVKAPGAFLVMAVLVAALNAAHISNAANKKVEGCDGCCSSCTKSCQEDGKEATEE